MAYLLDSGPARGYMYKVNRCYLYVIVLFGCSRSFNVPEPSIQSRPGITHTVSKKDKAVTQHTATTEQHSNTDLVNSKESTKDVILTPQEILEMKLNDPSVTLRADESIALVSHCAQLGEKNAEKADNKVVTMILGNTGVGKSTFCNYLMGCTMQEIEPEKLGVRSLEDYLMIVSSDSTHPEIMPIGHEDTSKTFMPQIETDTENTNLAYCDCPGFADNRGEEINIANAINTKRVLQQATGVKAVFLVDYNHITTSRGNNIRIMDIICTQMFGGVHNLEKYRNAVLLGITKAPKTVRANHKLTDKIKASLNRKGDAAKILAERTFFFDPLDSETTNPNFWSREQIRTAIDGLGAIPHQEAAVFSQTVLTSDDQTRLKHIIRDQVTILVEALGGDRYEIAEHHWESIGQLRVISNEEVDKTIEELAALPLHNFVLQRAEQCKAQTLQYNFREAEEQLGLLRRLLKHFHNANLEFYINALERLLRNCEEKKRQEEESIKAETDKIHQEAGRKAQEQVREAMRRDFMDIINKLKNSK